MQATSIDISARIAPCDWSYNTGREPLMPVRIHIVCCLLLVLPGLVYAQYRLPRRTRSSGPNGVRNGETPPVSLRGTLRSINKKEIVIDTGDDQIVTFKRSKKTRFLKGTKEIQPVDFPQRAAIVIEANRAMNGDLEAVN